MTHDCAVLPYGGRGGGWGGVGATLQVLSSRKRSFPPTAAHFAGSSDPSLAPSWPCDLEPVMSPACLSCR